MSIYPIIMCGGAGTRLWPASRPSRPKQFMSLAGNRSLFQDTVTRVASLAEDGGDVVVIAGLSHRHAIENQLSEIGVEAHIILEPEARDSAAAMAVGALWVRQRDPEGIIVFVASDHYIPDGEAFRAAVRQASDAAGRGQIVTLGVTPTEASSAYGYIKSRGPGLSLVASFYEKPDAEVAESFVADGYFWNSGNFIVSASTLIQELALYAPAVLAAAQSAIAPQGQAVSSGRQVQILGEAFLTAPRISIDYAVMELTQAASVLPVDFAWSDLGAWDAIAACGAGNIGVHILEDAERILARSPDGTIIAALGVRDLAIIVENDAVLVCDLARSQEIRKVVERIRTISPRHLDFETAEAESLEAGGRRFADWLRLRALPLWSTLGLGSDGGFHDSLTLDGQAVANYRRGRVQSRQIFVYAQAGLLGWKGPWRQAVTSAIACLRTAYLRPDGMTRSVIGLDWRPIDESATLYDQAFVLFALAAARKAEIDDSDLEPEAGRLRDLLMAGAMPNGALRERGEQPFQSNAHMHLFEAALAWEALSSDAAWGRLCDQIATLALNVFIDPAGGFLREFFDEDWCPAAGDAGRLVEPGHQFEWAWLLQRYALLRNDDRAAQAARRLYAAGRRGVVHRPTIAVDAMNDDLTVRSARARLWPQTEWMKAALLLAETATDGERRDLLDDAGAALRGLWLYLTDIGLWHDKRLPDGSFVEEPAPATSLYHIIGAFRQLSDTMASSDAHKVASLDLR